MRLFFTLMLSFSLSSLFSQTTIYVNQNVNGGAQDGSDWANALTDLQQALAIATEGDAIWVAKGTYYPTNDNDRSISFVLKQGVRMLGGFLGSEQTESLRDFVLNETVLSGNIGQPDGSDNSSHVLRGEGLDSTTVLDGFVVRHGNADSPGEYGYGGGLLLSPSQSVYNTCPIIQNCRFEHNYAFQGGAISADRIDEGYYFVNPIIRNCQFFYNRASSDGGAYSKTGPSLLDIPVIIDNCVFEKNASSFGNGGAVCISKMSNDLVIRSSSFHLDSAILGSGGAVYFQSGNNPGNGDNVKFEICNFRENNALEGGGIMVYGFTGINGAAPTPLSVKITTCEFEKNIATNGIGAAYYIYGFEEIDLRVDVQDCRFVRNETKSNCVTYIVGKQDSKVKISVKKSWYIENKRYGNPGELAFPLIFGVGGTTGSLDAVVDNCLFNGNSGGISSVCGPDGKINTLITNCTFINNTGFIINKSYHSTFDWINRYARTIVRNSVIWEPNSNLWSMFGDNDLTINAIQGYFIDHNLLSLDSFQAAPTPPLFGLNNILHQEPQFVDAANGDFRLLPCSPGVNAGENLVVDTLGLSYDLAGNPRKKYGTVDMGAFEAQDSCQVSGTEEPKEPGLAANMSPNPVGRGEKLKIQLSGFLSGKVRWAISDSRGSWVSNGEIPLFFPVECWIPMPNTAGVYVLKIWDAEQTIVKKVEVWP